MKTLYMFTFLFLFTISAYSQPVINGILDEPQYLTLAVQDSAGGWGDLNLLGSIKFYSTGNKLYIGIAGIIEPNWNKILLLVNFDTYNGIDSSLPAGGNGYFTTIGGTDPEIQTDFAFAFTTEWGNPMYVDAIRYGTNNVISGGEGIGSSNRTGTPSTFDTALIRQRLGGVPGSGITMAYLGTYNRTTNSNHGIEMVIDLGVFPGATALSKVNFFVAITGGNGDWFSKIFLPDYYYRTGGASGPVGSDFGADPDIEWKAWNARTNFNFPFVKYYTNPLVQLPVELTSFTASRTDNSTCRLVWTTATETNNSGFEVLRSVDNKEWAQVGFVKGAVNSPSSLNYSFEDKIVTYEKLYYRLRQVDTDGSNQLSDVVEVSRSEMPGDIVLEQNYPNPFNPSTNIRFSVKNGSHSTLKVYDAIGNMVAELFNGNAEAGKIYNVNFDGKNLSSGVYYYRLTSGNFVQAKKLLLVK